MTLEFFAIGVFAICELHFCYAVPASSESPRMTMGFSKKSAANTPAVHGCGQLGMACLERRGVVRFSCFAMALGEYAAGESTRFFKGRIVDLSLKRVGLRVRQKLEMGVEVSLVLEHAIGIFQCQRSAKVIHTRRDGDFWIVGCEFTVPLTPQELRRFHVATPLR